MASLSKVSPAPSTAPPAWLSRLTGWLVFLVPLVFDKNSLIAFGPVKLTLALALIAAGLGFWLARRRTETQSLRLPLSLGVVAGLWLLWQLVATVLSVNPLRSLAGSPDWLQGLMTRLGFAALALMAWLAAPAGARSLRGYVIAGSLPPVVYGLTQVLHFDPLVWARPDWELSTFGNPNFFAGYLIMLLPLTIWAAFDARRQAARAGLYLLAALQVVALYFTDSRGGWIAAAVGLGLVVLWRWRFDSGRAQILLAALAGLSLLITLAVAASGDLVGRLVDPDLARFPAWQTALNASLARPLTGFGPATFDLIQADFATPRLRWLTYTTRVDGVMDRAHNLWLELTVETGLPGLGLWVALLAAVIGPALKAAGQAGPLRGVLLGGVTALAAGVVHLLFNPSDIGFLTVFWWLLGWVAGATAWVRRGTPPGREMAPETMVLALQALFICAALGSLYAVRQWLAF